VLSRTTRRPATGSLTNRRATFRPDIEGLRALAVGLVIVDHFVGAPRGGFVGVDVFFVVSGYLISGMLIREIRESGSVSLTSFYARRARRILPAALATIVVTTAVSFAVFHAPRAQQVLFDAIPSALFVQNWHLIRAGSMYFSPAGLPSPLQHLWSLSVEEQFYIVWPWLLLGVLAVARALGRAHLRLLLPVLGTAVALSFAISLWESLNKPNWSYFSIESRAWELGAGALIAIVGPWISARLGGRPRIGLFFGGLTALVVSAFVISPDTVFPAPWAAAPVLACGMILVAGEVGKRQWWVLTNPAMRYLGRISFSLYLWHYPVYIVAVSLHPERGVALTVAMVVSTLALSVACYHLVEKPLRRPSSRAGFRRPARVSRPMVALGCAAVIALSVGAMTGPGWSVSGPAAAVAAPVPPSGGVDPESVSPSVEAAAAATTWPALDPALDSLSAADGAAAQYQTRGCLISAEQASTARLRTSARDCSFGDVHSNRVAVVIGDSIAVSWMPAVIGALAPRGWRIVGLGIESCPITTVTVNEQVGDSAFPAACDAARARAIAVARALGPDLVIMSSALGSMERLASGAGGEAAQSAWTTGTAASIAALSTGSDRIAVVESPPESLPISDCATRVAGPQTCAYRPSETWFRKTSSERRAASDADTATVAFVSTSDWFCTASFRCPAFAGGVPIKVDNGHLSAQYSARLGQALAVRLQRDGLVDQ
jgi:peptidoglycan/LPS O-acetylase OafA/YrhL